MVTGVGLSYSSCLACLADRATVALAEAAMAVSIRGFSTTIPRAALIRLLLLQHLQESRHHSPQASLMQKLQTVAEPLTLSTARLTLRMLSQAVFIVLPVLFRTAAAKTEPALPTLNTQSQQRHVMTELQLPQVPRPLWISFALLSLTLRTRRLLTCRDSLLQRTSSLLRELRPRRLSQTTRRRLPLSSSISPLLLAPRTLYRILTAAPRIMDAAVWRKG